YRFIPQGIFLYNSPIVLRRSRGMSRQTRILFPFLAVALLIAGCKSKSSTPPVAAQPAATPSQPTSAPSASASAPGAAATDPTVATVEENKKLSAIDWALKQDEIKHYAS